MSSSLRAERPPRWSPAGLAWALWALAMLGIAAGLWRDHLLRQAGRADLVQANGNALAWLLAGGRGRGRGAVAGGGLPAHPWDQAPAAALGGAGRRAGVAGLLMALAAMVTRNAAMRNWANGVSFAVLPPAIGGTILRYRLYDLDRILSRTLAYELLTVVLAGSYAVVVLGLGRCWAATPAWSSPPPPWPWRRCSSRHAAESRHRSTAAATTPPAPSPLQRPPPRAGPPGHPDRRRTVHHRCREGSRGGGRPRTCGRAIMRRLRALQRIPLGIVLAGQVDYPFCLVASCLGGHPWGNDREHDRRCLHRRIDGRRPLVTLPGRRPATLAGEPGGGEAVP